MSGPWPFTRRSFPWDISPNGVLHRRPGVKELYFFNSGDTLHGALYVMEDGFHVINHSIDFQDGLSVHPSFNVRNCKETLELVEKLGGKTQLYVDPSRMRFVTGEEKGRERGKRLFRADSC